MTDRKYILARNYNQYKFFIVRNHLNPKEYRYLSRAIDFAGVHNIITVEGYAENPTYMQMYEFITFMCNCEYIKLDEDYPKTRVEIIYA